MSRRISVNARRATGCSVQPTGTPPQPPENTVTEDGYLDPAFCAKDVTHANRRHGEAVLRQIVKISNSKGLAALR